MNAKSILGSWFRSMLTIISPRLNANIVYFIKKHKRMNWDNPETFAEKLVKLRIENYNSNELVKKCADKYLVREYVVECGCPELLNELICVYDNPEDIQLEKLPNRFALKLNYGCGYNIICDNKEDFDIKKSTKKIKRWYKQKPWLHYGEMQYKVDEKKVLVERFLEGKNGLFPEDYKFYCFNGEPKAILYMMNRETHSIRTGFFDLDWNYLGQPKSVKKYSGFDECSLPECPHSLREMAEAAKKLSAPFPFVRVDFYDLDGKPIFGEMTFSPVAGFNVSEIELEGRSMGTYFEV